MPEVIDVAGLRYCITDAGRAQSKWPHEDNDCAVRSLAHATGLSYTIAHQVCGKAGRRYRTGIEIKWYRKPGWFLCWVRPPATSHFHSAMVVKRVFLFREHKFPAIVGKRRMHPKAFAKKFPRGRYILNEGGHVEACCDGIFYDDRLRGAKVQQGHKLGSLKTFRVIYSAFQVYEVPWGAGIYEVVKHCAGKKGRRVGLCFGETEQAAKLQAYSWYPTKDTETLALKALRT